ncbi:MAG: hypothetical protein JJD92_09415 [Frankiaceae bacterium]|nr:hypothetical protein [Frankiaceae bacterium]
MFTRIVSFTDAKDLDSGIAFVRDVVTPVLHSQRGWRGTTASADRSAGVFAVLTLWESEADRDASESALLKVRDEGHKVIGGHVNVEYFEEVGGAFAAMPTIGSKLLVTRVSMDAAKVDEIIAEFGREVAPQITSAPGFQAYRQMVNRETGDAIVGTTWADADSRSKALAMAEERQRSGKMPVTIRERSERDIVFIDLPS